MSIERRISEVERRFAAAKKPAPCRCTVSTYVVFDDHGNPICERCAGLIGDLKKVALPQFLVPQTAEEFEAMEHHRNDVAGNLIRPELPLRSGLIVIRDDE